MGIINAVNNDNHFDDDDDLGITAETAAAIDSIVSRIDVVEELQDDVDLGLDVIGDGDISDHQDQDVLEHEQVLEAPTVHEDQPSETVERSRDELIPSPHDIEISNEESTKIDTLSQNFYQRNHGRVPVLRLERLRLGHDCISSVNGRVDLKILKKASPGLFPKRKYTKRADGKKGEIDSSDSGHHE